MGLYSNRQRGGGRVEWDDTVKNVPFSTGPFTVRKVSDYIVVKSSFGFEVSKFDICSKIPLLFIDYRKQLKVILWTDRNSQQRSVHL